MGPTPSAASHPLASPPAPDPLRVAVIGARRRRQGTGGWIARALARSGCRVDAIVGTTPETIEAARAELRADGIACRGYPSLADALAGAPLDAVAVCSPLEAHERDLELAVAAGCHVLCEKPLLDPRAAGPDAQRARVEALLDAAAARRRVLAVNTQWPWTLEAFRRLHPDAPRGAPARFRMWLAPISQGVDMVVDSGSHLLSMLLALCGPGRVAGARAAWLAPDRSALRLACRWVHAAGETAAELELRRCPEPPRPAGYALDDRAAERRVELPGYRIAFAAEGRQVPVPDPLEAAVAAFVRAARAGELTDRSSIVLGVTELHPLVLAARQAQEVP